MGATLAKQVIATWGHLPDRQKLLLLHMALTVRDDDPEPVYWGGAADLAYVLGKGTNPKGPEVVRLTIAKLIEAGALVRVGHAHQGRRARYALTFSVGRPSLDAIAATPRAPRKLGVTHRPPATPEAPRNQGVSEPPENRGSPLSTGVPRAPRKLGVKPPENRGAEEHKRNTPVVTYSGTEDAHEPVDNVEAMIAAEVAAANAWLNARPRRGGRRRQRP